MRFFVRTRVIGKPRKLCLQTNKGRRSAERRGGRYRGPAKQALPPVFAFIAARAPFGRRARLPALYRGSRQRPRGLRLSPVPRFMVADNRSAPRAASSWRTGVVAGRASFRTASRTRLRTPPRAPLPLASIGRHRLTSLGRAGLCSAIQRQCQGQKSRPSGQTRAANPGWSKPFG
jgi:hypothetical protein